MATRKTSRPNAATRHIETTAGILSYQELAPLLAERVGRAEVALLERQFAAMPIHDLLLELHRRLCADLLPDMAGRWRRKDVQVSGHIAPPYWEVPELMRRYADDLDARLSALGQGAEDLLLETLTFAEGRFLFIHPFDDFNGRVSRLFLRELLRRLELPLTDFAMTDQGRTQYFAALTAYDQQDPRPLTAIWQARFQDMPP